MEEEEFGNATPKKKLKLLLNKKKPTSSSELPTPKASRFAASVFEEEVEEAGKGVDNAWAERTRDAWVEE